MNKEKRMEKERKKEKKKPNKHKDWFRYEGISKC